MRITTQLASLAAASVAALVVLISIAAGSFGEFGSAEKDLALTEAITANYFQRSSLADQFFLHREDRLHREWDAKQERSDALLRQAATQFRSGEDQILLGRIRKSIEESNSIFHRIVANTEAMKKGLDGNDILLELDKRLENQFLLKVISIRIDLTELSKANSGTLEKAYQHLAAMVVTLVAVFGFTTSVTLLRIRQVVSKHLLPLHVGAKMIGEGDLTHRIAIHGSDELCELAASINAMTDRLNAEAQARRIGERGREEALSGLQKIASRVPGVVFQFRLLPDGRSCFPYASEALQDVFRVSPQAVHSDATPVFSRLHPDDIDRVVASIRTSAHELTAWQCEYRVKFDDEGVRWLLGNALPERDADGSTLWYGFMTDITERRFAEEKLRTLSYAVENSPASIVITDTQANIEYVNPRFTEVSGYGASEVMGKNPSILRSGKTPSETYAELWKRLKSGQAWHGELINRRKNGEIYWEDSQLAPVKDTQGHLTHFIAIKSDVTERVRAAQRLDEVLREQGKILNNDLVGIVTVKDRMIVWANPAYEGMLGYAPGELVGAPTRQTYDSEQEYLAVGDAAYATLMAGKVFRAQVQQRHKDGHRVWVDASGDHLNREKETTLWSFIDITERKQIEETVRQLAFHDALTGLPNRRLLIDRLSQTMAASKRNGRYAALMFLDLDNFKPLNDAHGHEVGDLLLVEVAHRLIHCVRAIDTVARFGGDEFVVMLTELNEDAKESTAQALAIAEKIRLSLAQTYTLAPDKREPQRASVLHHCTASIGVVLFQDQHQSEAQVLKSADAAMYTAKMAGRDAVRLYAGESGR